MKKLVMTATLLTAVIYNATAQIKLGVVAGANVSVAKISDVTSRKAVTSPTIGIVAQADFGPLLFRPSVNYLQNGFETAITESIGGFTTLQKDVLKVNNIEIPLDIVVPLNLKGGRLLFSASPVITVGLNGKYTSATSLNNTQVANQSGNVKFGSEAGEIKKVDFGSRFGLGYEFKNGLQINAAYKLGLSNQTNVKDETIKNHYVALTASWFLFK
jgi:hypothetical protein